MNTIKQSETGCYLLHGEALTVQTENSFKQKVLHGNALKIDGIHTYQDNTYSLNWKQEKVYKARRGGTDCYDYRNATILIDGTMHYGGFVDLHNNRLRYYINDDGIQCVITVSSIRLKYDRFLNQVLYNGTDWAGDFSMLPFSVVINTPMSHMDFLAPKLASY